MGFKEFYEGIIKDCEMGPLGRFMLIPTIPFIFFLPALLGLAFWTEAFWLWAFFGALFGSLLTYIALFFAGFVLFIVGFGVAALVSWIVTGEVKFDLDDAVGFIFEPVIDFIIFVYALLFMRSETKRAWLKANEVAKEKLTDES